MRVRQARFALAAGGVACGIGALAALSWAMLWPCAVRTAVALADKRQTIASSPPSAEPGMPTLATYTAHWGKLLQRPLREDAVAAAQAAATAMAQKRAGAFSVVLVGTMIEEGFSRALFSVPPGTTELKAVGDSVGIPPVTAEIVKIEHNEVVVRYQGQLLTLRLKGADEG